MAITPPGGIPMTARDLIGKRGEAIVCARLTDFCGNPLPYFDPHPLGEKCPTFDYLVELVDAGAVPAYFLAQVKATRKGYTRRTADLKVGVRAADVAMMVRCPIPTYLIGVDEPAGTAYIVSVHGSLKGRISAMPSDYTLDATNLRKLWTEVRDYWRSVGKATKKSSAFTF